MRGRLAEAAGFRCGDDGAAALDPALRDSREQLEGMGHSPATVFAPVVGEVVNLALVIFVERQHAVAEHVHGGHGQVRKVQLAEAQPAVGVEREALLKSL